MKAIILVLAAAVFGTAAADTLSGRVVGVVDGDTVDILVGGSEQVRVRLGGIDAPEKAQAFGQAAKRKMSDLVFGKAVEVETAKRDRYGRVIGNVFADGSDAGLALVRAGLAWHYKQYQGEQSAAARERYSAAEADARRERLGLWADAEPVPPWEWRKNGGKPTGAASAEPAPAKRASANGRFTCGGKTTCREMSSCEEARFYLTQCGVSRLDRDRDGIPCESICR